MPDYAQYRIIVDLPSPAPVLGFDNIAGALAHAIETSRPRFAVGIFGAWGSGKTTLMQAVRARLAPQRTVCVEFSAWRYEREEFLLVPLLDTIRAALVAWADEHAPAPPAGAASALRGALLDTASTVSRVLTSLVAGMSLKVGLPNALEFSFEANDALARADALARTPRNEQSQASGQDDVRSRVRRLAAPDFPQSVYHAGYEQLQRAFAALRGNVAAIAGEDLRFVVFVDDLDRCLPQGALEVLESIKLFFELEGFVFVVGLDRAIVERFIEQRYAGVTGGGGMAAAGTAAPAPAPLVSGAEYIKKIFQVPYNLAQVQHSQLDDLIMAMARDGALPPDQEADLRDRVQAHLRVLLADVAVNPREVKRFVNAYVMQMKITPFLDPDVVLVVQTVRARLDWKTVDDALAEYRDEFLVALRAQLVDGQDGALADVDAGLANLPRSFLEYVSAGGPGHALLAPDVAQQLGVYLYSVDATSSQGTALVDALRMLAGSRRTLRAAVQATAGAAFGEAQEALRNVRSMVGSLEQFPAVRLLLAELERVERTEAQLPILDGLDAEQAFRRAADALLATMEALTGRVRALRRQGLQ